MSENRLPDYLRHIEQAAEEAISFTANMEKGEFLDDRLTQQAVVMSLVIIGEAAAKVMDRYPEFAEEHSNVSWRSMRGMRNRIAHGYFELDFDVVWETVKTALPDLLSRMPKAPVQ